MPRAAVKNLLASLALIFFISCTDITPTYTRAELANVLTKICKDEFNLTVHAWDEGDTIWLYSPLNNTDSTGQITLDNLRRTLRTIGRVILSVDERPQFYCLVLSDIKNGGDVYLAGYGNDRFLFEMGGIPWFELAEREVFMPVQNPNAIGDTEGTHINRHEITMGEFISFLIQQSLEKKFLTDQLKNLPHTNEIKAEYTGTVLSIKINIPSNADRQPPIDPFDETRKTTKHFLEIYKPQDISEIVISNATKTNRYSVQDLLNEK